MPSISLLFVLFFYRGDTATQTNSVTIYRFEVCEFAQTTNAMRKYAQRLAHTQAHDM